MLSTPPATTHCASLERDLAVALDDRLESGRTEPVDRHPGDAVRQPGEQRRHARHVAVVFTCLIGCAGVDLVDQCGVDTAARNDLANHLCEQVIRPDIGELTSEPTDR